MHEGGSLSNIVENFNAWYEVLDFAFVIRKWVQLNVKESALDLIKVTPAIEFECFSTQEEATWAVFGLGNVG